MLSVGGGRIHEFDGRLMNFNSNGLLSISQAFEILMQKGKFSLRLKPTPIF